MAVLAVGLGGAAVGSFFGQAALGWAIGSFVGQTLFGPDTPDVEGPRIGDRSVQSSSYGWHIPKCYGTFRTSGNVIWSSDLIETAHEESTGGKGLGGGGGDVTTYTYSVNCQVMVCEAPAAGIAGIRKIWANGKLIFNGASTSAGTLFDSAARFRVMRIYKGTETQDPDPLVESAIGIGNTSAMRGYAHVVFDNLQLADFGNVIPNFTFEVVTLGTEDEFRHLGNFNAVVNDERANGFSQPVYGASIEDGIPYFHVSSTSGNNLNFARYRFSPDNGAILSVDSGFIDRPATSNYIAPLLGGRRVRKSGFRTGSLFLSLPGATAGIVGQELPFRFRNFDGSSPRPGQDVLTGFCVTNDGAHLYVLLWRHWDTGSPTILQKVDSELNVVNEWDVTGQFYDGAHGSNDAGLWPGYSGGQFQFESNGRFMWYVFNDIFTVYNVYEFDEDTGTLTLIKHFDQNSGEGSSSEAGPTGSERNLIADNGVCWTVAESVSDINVGIHTRVAQVSVTDVTLDDIVSDIMIDNNLITASDIDVTALSSITVRGYARTRIMRRREALIQLQRAYQFDIIESEHKLVCRLRTGKTVTSIPFNDLGVGLSRPQQDPYVDERANSLEMPKAVNLNYISRERDYQPASQRALRQQPGATDEISVSVAVVLTTAQAAQTVEILMYDSWASRNVFTVFLGTKYFGLEPADVISFPDGSRTLQMRITDINRSWVSLLECTCVLDNNDTYVSTAEGDLTNVEAPFIDSLGPTNFLPLNLPLLREFDDIPVLYYAAAGLKTNWQGAQIYRSIDEGDSFVVQQGVFDESIIGIAQTSLANGSEFQIDEVHTVDVQIPDGKTLTTITDAQFQSGINAAAIGVDGRWEVIFFRDVTNTSGNVWRLSHLMRGLFGTIRHAATHTDKDLFVVLSGTTTKGLGLGFADFGLELLLKAVSVGTVVATTPQTKVTWTAENMLPYAPVHPILTVNGSGDLTVEFTRQDRKDIDWDDSGDEDTLSEDSEEYEYDVLDNSDSDAVILTVTGLTTNSFTLTAATMSGNSPAIVAGDKIRIYQISQQLRTNTSSNGRGHYLEITIP